MLKVQRIQRNTNLKRSHTVHFLLIHKSPYPHFSPTDNFDRLDLIRRFYADFASCHKIFSNILLSESKHVPSLLCHVDRVNFETSFLISTSFFCNSLPDSIFNFQISCSTIIVGFTGDDEIRGYSTTSVGFTGENFFAAGEKTLGVRMRYQTNTQLSSSLLMRLR